MPMRSDLVGVGMSPEKAAILELDDVGSSPRRTVATALTATGTTITDAYQINKLNSQFSTVALNTGAKLNSSVPIGQFLLIQNDGANPLNVYPHSSSGTINGGSAGAAVTTAAAAAALCFRTTSTNWLVYVLAKEA